MPKKMKSFLRKFIRILKAEPKIRLRDRLFWILVSRYWKKWKDALIVVKPETVIGWMNNTFAIDFFTVPTATFKVLYVFIVLLHEDHKIVHFNVT